MTNNLPTIGFGPNSLAVPSALAAEPWWATFIRPLRDYVANHTSAFLGCSFAALRLSAQISGENLFVPCFKT
jgi:hypothetical protein